MKPLTPRQQSVLEFIWAEVQKRKRPPTVREISAAFAASTATGMWCHVKALRRKGWLEVDPTTARGLRLTRAARKQYTGFPLVNLAEISER